MGHLRGEEDSQARPGGHPDLQSAGHPFLLRAASANAKALAAGAGVFDWTRRVHGGPLQRPC
jgi:hypothetical protein